MRLARLFGIDIRLNLFFILLFLLYYYCGIAMQTMIVFVSVFVHELGHIVVAQGYGVRTMEIELLPFGGVARMEKGLEIDPGLELFVSIAGPITSGFLALFGLFLHKMGIGNQSWLPFFIQANAMLALFNLAPAYPLDGGRVLRALLSLRVGLKQATDFCLAFARGIGIVLAAIGIWSCFGNQGRDFNFLILAVFLIFSTVKEKQGMAFMLMKFMAQKKEDLTKAGILVGRHITTGQFALLKDVVKFFVPRKYHMVTVVDKKHAILGTLTEGEVIDGLFRYGPDTQIANLLEKHN